MNDTMVFPLGCGHVVVKAIRKTLGLGAWLLIDINFLNFLDNN
jgi:hypothetical protein